MNRAPSKLVFATRNENKIREVNRIFTLENILIDQILSLDDIDCGEDIPETSMTIAGNAAQKATYVFDNYGMNCFAEDTGLCIDALNGEPGIFSARYAGDQKNAENNIDLVLKKMVDQPIRSAHFLTVVALNIDGNTEIFEGRIDGIITQKRRGESGFGYDPIFLPDGHELTFGEMDMDLKNKISHRFLAFEKLINHLGSNF